KEIAVGIENRGHSIQIGALEANPSNQADFVEVNGVHYVAGADFLNQVELAGNVWGQRVIAGIRGKVGAEGFIDIKEIGVGAQFVGTVVVVAVRELAGEIGQQDRCSRSAGKIVVPEGVGELMGITEFSADFDSGKMGAQVITLGRRSEALEIQLSGESRSEEHTS